ncbi:MAG: hypothetical protein ABW171_12590 [Steroidobacter sp.]
MIALQQGRSFCALLYGALMALACTQSPAAERTPGTLANPGFEGQPMKSLFFFPGQWRGMPGEAWYDGPIRGVRLTPVTNKCLYTVWPDDGDTHFGWSDNNVGDNRERALNEMLATGANVVNMSYWGTPDTDRWSFWAPMHSAIGAHNELFDAAAGKPLLITPYIEDGSTTILFDDDGHRIGQKSCEQVWGPLGNSPGYRFTDDFPGTRDNPAPKLVEQILDLVNRYLRQPAVASWPRSEWPKKWTQMYDKDGKARYVISLIHVASNQLDPRQPRSHETFAQGFTWVADRVFRETGIAIGFTLDVLPPDHAERGRPRFLPTPSDDGTARHLKRQAAVLAIQPFIPEIHTGQCRLDEFCDSPEGSPALQKLLKWKYQFVKSWVHTDIPVMLDVSPGYDGRHVFKCKERPDRPCTPELESRRYGNTEPWREGQRAMLSLPVRGITGNTWNGYTEGFAIVPSCVFSHTRMPPGIPRCGEPGTDVQYRWFTSLNVPGSRAPRTPTRLEVIAHSDSGTITFRLSDALLGTPVESRNVRIRIGEQTFDGTTDVAGRVSVTAMEGSEKAPALPLAIKFDGDDQYLPIETRIDPP